MTDAKWTTREDYIVRLATACRLSGGAAEAEVNRALGSGRVRRRGWRSDDFRCHLWELGEPDPGPGPSEPHLPLLPISMERNVFARIEYSVADLDYETRHIRRHAPRRAKPTKPPQEEVNLALFNFARRFRRLKQSDEEARSLLVDMGATSRQILAAFHALPEDLRFGVGKK